MGQCGRKTEEQRAEESREARMKWTGKRSLGLGSWGSKVGSEPVSLGWGPPHACIVNNDNVCHTVQKPVTEESKCEPWTNMARHKLKVEQLLGNFPDLTYTILRPAIVYGIGDRQGLTPRLLIGAIYRYTKEKMKLLWTKDLHMNTVHVVDVCAAVWHLFTHGHRGQVYQLADKGNTSKSMIIVIIIVALKGAIQILYNLLTVPRTVSNSHALVARAQSCANNVQHIERLSCATCHVPCDMKGQLSF